jgi:hypothetical protein
MWLARSYSTCCRNVRDSEPRDLFLRCRNPCARSSGLVYTTAHGPGNRPTPFQRMNHCPSCSKPLQTEDLVCPHCGISLHPGTATAGPASGGGGGMSVVATIVIAIVCIVVLAGCLGVVGFAFWFTGTPVAAPPPTPVPPPMVKKMATFPPMESIPVQEAPENMPPVDEAPSRKPNPEKSTNSP